ncbi:MAG: NAD-dependent epimerase/dehydratase family protein [Myxococcota bacterium]
MHLVLGADSAFGLATVRALLAAGQRVRGVVAGEAALPEGVEVVRGDAQELAPLVEAAKGCESIVHALEVPFHRWDTDYLRATDHVAEAAGLTGAAVVFPGRLWSLKPVYEVPLPPDGPALDVNDRPSLKGRLLAGLEDQLRQNTEMRNVRTLIVRSPEMFGPGVDDPVVAPMLRAALAGRPVPWLGRADVPRAYAFTEDVAAVAVALLLRKDRPAFEVAGVAGHVLPHARAWAEAFAKAAGTAPAGVRARPGWQLRLAGLVDRATRHLAELAPHWEGPLYVDDTDTNKALPDWKPVRLDDALHRTMQALRG